MTKTKPTRIGQRMRQVQRYVAAHPGEYMVAAARAVGPHGSTRYGYQAVHRAIAAGLVDAVPDGGGDRARLYPIGSAS